MLFTCAYTCYFGKETARRQAPKSLLKTPPAKLLAPKEQFSSRIGCVQTLCQEANSPLPDRSSVHKAASTPKNRQNSASLKKNSFDRPAWKGTGSSTAERHLLSLFAWQRVLPTLSAAFGGLQNFADAQMPSRILLTRVLEQRVVSGDLTALLSAAPAGSAGAVALLCLCHTPAAGHVTPGD